MEEMTDMEALRAIQFRMNNLIDFAAQETDMRLRDYSHQLYMHNVRKVEPELNKRKNSQMKIVANLIDSEEGLSTKKLMEELQAVATKEYDPINLHITGLNDEEMQRNHMVFMSLVDRAKRDGQKRIERLKESYEQVTANQKQIMRQAVDDYKQHRGYHRLKNRLLELDNQLSKQRTVLAERKYQYEVRKAESTQTAEELRSKYEAETEELIRSLLQTIEIKQSELETLQKRHEDIRHDIDRICKDLSVVLHDLEKEEKSKLGKRHGRRTHINSKGKNDGNDTQDDSDVETNNSNNNNGQSKKDSEEVTIMDVFPFIKVGELTDEMTQKTYALVDESAAILHNKQAEKEYAEQKLAMKKNELNAILKSEESKALERLKKMVMGLESKIDSDEKRAALLESLVKNLEQDSKGNKSTAGKGVFAKMDKENAYSGGNANRRSRNLAYGSGTNSVTSNVNNNKGKAEEAVGIGSSTKKFDDESSDDNGGGEENDDNDTDDVDTGGNPIEIERKRLRKLEKEARRKMEATKKGKIGIASDTSVASEGSNSLSFGTNDSKKFLSLQAKFLQSSQTVASRLQQAPQTVPMSISMGGKSPVSIKVPEKNTSNEANSASTPLITQRFIAPSQVSKILQTMDAFDYYTRPPVWALGPSNVLIPYSPRISTSNKPEIAGGSTTATVSTEEGSKTNNIVPFSVQRLGGKVPAPPAAPRVKTPHNNTKEGTTNPLNSGRLVIEAHGIDSVNHHPTQNNNGHPHAPVAKTLTQRLEDQFLAGTKEERQRLLSREEKAKLEEEKQQQDYFMQSYGFHLAMDQLQMLMELLTHWGGTAPEQTTLDNLKEVMSPGNGTTNIMMGMMKVRTEEEELEDLERMRHQTQEVLLSMKLAYRQNKSLHHVLKDTTKAVQSEVRRCDEIKRQLFGEIQGLKWEQHLQPGQYQQEMKDLKEKVLVLKGELRLWETKIRQQSKSNNRMSQALTDETTARKISEGIADKVRQQEEMQQRKQKLAMSTLSSITGRSFNSNNNNSNNAKSALRSKFQSTIANITGQKGLLASIARNSQQQQNSNNNKSTASLSTAGGVSAASSSILEELSDLEDGLDHPWSTTSSSFSKMMEMDAKKASTSPKKKLRGGNNSSIAPVCEVTSNNKTNNTSEISVSEYNKANITNNKREDSQERSIVINDVTVVKSSSLSLESEVENNQRRSFMQDIMSKPSKHNQSLPIKRQTHIDSSDDGNDVHVHQGSGNTDQKYEHDKLKLYHDATDIYAQAMRDLSESQKKK